MLNTTVGFITLMQQMQKTHFNAKANITMNLEFN